MAALARAFSVAPRLRELAAPLAPLARRALSASTGKSSAVPTAASPAAGAAEVVPFDVAEARRVAVLSEARDDAHVEAALRRKVTIFKQGQHAMTSGTGGAGWWGLKVAHEAKWANGLMGWVSSADTQRQPTINLRFDTAEQAVIYCERNGLEYEVLEPAEHARGAVLNQYQYNFLPLELQTRMKAMGARKSVPVFAHPDAPSQTGVSTFVNYRYTQRGAEAWKPRTDGTYAKGVAQTASAWTGPAEWDAPKRIPPPDAAEGGAH